jgi:hypothetical protein
LYLKQKVIPVTIITVRGIRYNINIKTEVMFNANAIQKLTKFTTSCLAGFLFFGFVFNILPQPQFDGQGGLSLADPVQTAYAATTTPTIRVASTTVIGATLNGEIVATGGDSFTLGGKEAGMPDYRLNFMHILQGDLAYKDRCTYILYTQRSVLLLWPSRHLSECNT